MKTKEVIEICEALSKGEDNSDLCEYEREAIQILLNEYKKLVEFRNDMESYSVERDLLT